MKNRITPRIIHSGQINLINVKNTYAVAFFSGVSNKRSKSFIFESLP